MIPQIEPVYGSEEINALTTYMESGGWLTEFKRTEEFEQRIAETLKVKYASVVNNGTISLTIALLALGIKPGDEVLVPNLTMIATPSACRLIGVNPILVDVSSEDLCMNLEEVKKKITKKTKAIIYVSLNGRGKYIKEFVKFCKENELYLIEDAAQSFGSMVDGQFLGTVGDIGSFSFSPHKIITTGQGGALVTNDEKLHENIERLKDFGRLQGGADIHDYFGINSKFTDIQAVIGIEQIKKINERIQRKKEIYSQYEGFLQENKFVEMIPTDLSQTTPWFVDIYVNDRDGLYEYLKKNGIGSRKVYPPINSQKIYNTINNFPISMHYCSKGLWLPSSINLSEEEIEFISGVVLSYFK